MNYNQANEYLNKAYTRGSHPGLSRVVRLLDNLNNPQNQLKIIHVTGTNGKGSVCAMLEQALCAAGIKTGLFTSPGLTRINECYRIGGEAVSDEAFAGIIECVKSAEAKIPPDATPTGFELETAAALELFRRAECEVVILETGMGGMLDATNVCASPLLSVITDIGMDHEAFLGNTIKDIAVHKSGIIKPNRPVVFGGTDDTDKEALRIIKDRAAELNSPLTVTEHDRVRNIKYSLSGTEFEFDLFSSNHKLRLPLLGLYQPRNCAVALTALEVLKDLGLSIDASSAADGLSRTVWRGRFEILSREPLIIYDGAHNPHGMNMCVKSIEQYLGRKINVLMGVMADKNYDLMLDMLCPYVDTAFTVTPDNPRALHADKLAECFRERDVNVSCFESIDSGVKSAVSQSKESGLPLVILGTLYMYRDIVDALK